MSENLMIGLEVMLIGISFVLLFLCLLVLSMNVMAKVVGYLNKIFPEQITAVQKIQTAQKHCDDELIAVALAATMLKK